MRSKLLIATAVLAAAAVGTARAQTTINSYAGGFAGDPGGNFSVGVGPDGELYDNTTGVGYQRAIDGFDPLAPGSPRDSWGVSIGGVSSYADYEDYGTSNVSSVSALTPGGGTVTSTVAGGTVKQTYQFVDENILKITMAVTNTSGAAAPVILQRDIDWDVAPTEFNENSVSYSKGVFGAPIPAGSNIIDSSYYGFENPDPNAPYGSSCAAGCNTNGDLGGGIKVSLGTLAAGATRSEVYYYAISNNPCPGGGFSCDSPDINTLAAEVAGLGGVYQIDTQSSENGNWPGVGANDALIAVGAVPEPATMTILGGALIGLGLIRRRRG